MLQFGMAPPNNGSDNVRPKIRNINQLWALLDEYAQAVQDSPLSQTSKVDYVSFAEMFVRWTDNDFVPGAKVK